MTDPSQPTAGQREPTEEELRTYLEQLREADVAQVVAQAFEVLGTGAQVKLGRADARVLIDTLEAVVEKTAGRVPDDLATQMRQAVRQLQLAQVQAEQELATAGSQPEDAVAGERPSGQAADDQQATVPPPDDQGQRMTDRLWVPGREPPPS